MAADIGRDKVVPPDESSGPSSPGAKLENTREKNSTTEHDAGYYQDGQTPHGQNGANAIHDGSDDDDENGDDTDDVSPPTKKKTPGLLARFVAKLGLDAPTLITMFRGSLPPVIGIAMYQATPVTEYFNTLGYLVPIISVLALAMLPRGKFMMNMVLNVLCVCFGSAVSLLALWSGVQARINTTPPGALPTRVPTYNASQSAVCGVWLFANIWFCNVVRAKLPAFNIPVIVYSILVNISATFGPFMTSTAAAEAFVKQLMTTMLVALALAAGVNLFVFPISSRLVVFKEFGGALGLLRKTVALQKAYLISIESEDMFTMATRTGTGATARPEHKPKLTKEAKAAKALEEAGAQLRELSGKLQGDIPFAKRDVAWGKLDANDISDLFTLVRNTYIPVLGMTTIIDIFKRVSERRGWNVDDDAPDELVAEKNQEKHVWNEVMRQMHEPFAILSEAIDQGLEHAGLLLELLPRPKTNKSPKAVDVEAQNEEVKPGEPGFARVVDEKVEAFNFKRGELLRTWVEHGGLPTDVDEDGSEIPGHANSAERKERDQVQLYILLFMENLMQTSGEAVQELVAFADAKVEDGTMGKKRLIMPGFRRLRKWFLAIISNQDASTEQAPDLMETANNVVHFSDGYTHKRDPEHLPPATPWEHFGNGLRKISDFFGSEESAFGIRAACATMTVGIVAFLEPTQAFFMEQRLVWAMIIIAIGMTMTSGQSFFGFLCRIGGTVIAMVCSLVIWYIVNEHVPGVIVFLWLSIFIDYYFFIKFPRFIPAVMITIVTQVLIVGYELQVLRIGQAAAEATGQRWYPTYLLGPYRLACVAGGSAVAFFWTIFPSPLTDRTWLRRDLSATLYLLANYFSVINSTLQSTLDNTAGDPDVPNSPANQLLKIRRKIFGKVMMLMPSMSQHSAWQKWEPTIGGKYPREAYDEIILRSTRIMGYLTLMSYTLAHRPRPVQVPGDDDAYENEAKTPELASTPEAAAALDNDDRVWINALAQVLVTLNPAHHTILSTLTLLSNALLSGQSLPPFLPLPRPYEMTRRLMKLNQDPDTAGSDSDPDEAPIKLVDSRTLLSESASASTRDLLAKSAAGRPVGDILDPRNMEQPGYAEFAVMQVCTTLVSDDLAALVKAVSGLVGVVDFTFHVDHQKGGKDVVVGDGLRGSASSSESSLGGEAKRFTSRASKAERRGRREKERAARWGKGKGKVD
ncbi:hypothetical protein B0T22DRAFT_415351 [Podospora appendiculata]|uniref:ER transporter 6TM N-terminal domain-containing protein n=1 Tax=Podospora appendiculata TaxID=314037 RepID=A0AAE0WYY8_9PEZI|nr:hypothetical protein B0T22DRAFT_415351 [Podospora appendiculata]